MLTAICEAAFSESALGYDRRGTSGGLEDGYTAMAKVAKRNVRDFAWEIAHEAVRDARRIPSTRV
jgi:hypothetical protein